MCLVRCLFICLCICFDYVFVCWLLGYSCVSSFAWLCCVVVSLCGCAGLRLGCGVVMPLCLRVFVCVFVLLCVYAFASLCLVHVCN